MQGAVADLPGWLLTGLALGGLLTTVVAVVFAVGTRLFPQPNPESGSDGGVAGEERRRDEIRAYLRSIGEPFSENRTIGGLCVAFYLPERDVAILFDPKTYFRLADGDTRAILVEHELPGAQIGARLPFETPDLDTTAAEDETAAAFAVLGLDPSATAQEVREAYRERIKAAHPDHGGDPESFERVREAYADARDHAD